MALLAKLTATVHRPLPHLLQARRGRHGRRDVTPQTSKRAYELFGTARPFGLRASIRSERKLAIRDHEAGTCPITVRRKGYGALLVPFCPGATKRGQT